MSRRKGVRILSICDDDGIRFSRELVLMQEGYEVSSVPSYACLSPDCMRSFHIAVLCHTVDAERAARLAEMLRWYNPSIGVLRVHSIRPPSKSFYDLDCEALPSPEELISGIRSLCAKLAEPRHQQGRRHA